MMIIFLLIILGKMLSSLFKVCFIDLTICVIINLLFYHAANALSIEVLIVICAACLSLVLLLIVFILCGAMKVITAPGNHRVQAETVLDSSSDQLGHDVEHRSSLPDCLTLTQFHAVNNDDDIDEAIVSTHITMCEGCNFLHSGLCVEIPVGAIPGGRTIPALYDAVIFGPFHFPVGLRPVSAIFTICANNQENFQFSKPVNVSIPHFLDLESDEQIESLGLTFLKANHKKNSEGLLEFQPTNGKMDFTTFKSHGILETTHFCSLCIGCKNSHECLKNIAFCITAVLPKLTIPVGTKLYAFFYITFLNLSTCLKRVEALISKMDLEKYQIIKEEFHFKTDTNDPSLEIFITQPRHGEIGLMGKKKVPIHCINNNYQLSIYK